jgi:hypothetical protein
VSLEEQTEGQGGQQDEVQGVACGGFRGLN